MVSSFDVHVSPPAPNEQLAPGSQNGFDNSGKYGAIQWTQGDTVTQTKNALNQIRDDHASHPAVAAIELVNEPMGTSSAIDTGTLKQFMMDGCKLSSPEEAFIS